jgi:hypothetical protein
MTPNSDPTHRPRDPPEKQMMFKDRKHAKQQPRAPPPSCLAAALISSGCSGIHNCQLRLEPLLRPQLCSRVASQNGWLANYPLA